MSEFFTRLGDGSGEMMSLEDIRYDVEDGTADAAERGEIPELTKEEIDHLVEILTMPQKNVSVERGREGIMTFDAGTLKLPVRAGVPVDRLQTLMLHERVLCSDTMELCTTDYSYKSIKNFIAEEAMTMELAQNNCVMPIFYGAMPNLGQYTKPDGPIDNWSELLPLGRIDEARAAQEEAVEHAVRDMVFMTAEQRTRHNVRPGLTGLAQVNGRNAIAWEDKLKFDLQYIAKITFWGDVGIILKTVFKVLKRSDVVRDGTVSDMDYGDWMLSSSLITREEYDEKQAAAKMIISERR